MYILSKSGHLKHTIRNFILGELLRYVRCSTQEFNFLEQKTIFSGDYGIQKTFSKKTLQESEAVYEKRPSKNLSST